MADGYTHGHHESVLRSHRWRTAENSAGYLLPYLRRGATVLDVGAGPGTITLDLAEIVTPGAVHGVDASADVIAEAEHLRSTLGRGADATFAVGDAYALDAADGSFDVVHAHQVLQHLTDPIAALREFGRVAGPAGLVAVRDVDYEGVVWYPRLPELDEWRDLYLQVHRGTSGEPAAGRHLKAWARRAGLRSVQTSASVWLFESAEDRDWWGRSWADRVVASSFASNAIELGLADDTLLRRIRDGWLEWADCTDGWLLMPHGEIVATAAGEA